MTKLRIDYSRKIENNTPDEDVLPIVGKPGENHIADDWTPETLYNGELFLNTGNGKIFTSDGIHILQLNSPKNQILSGLEVKRSSEAGSGIALDLEITNGYAIIDNKLVQYDDHQENVSNYQIDLTGQPVALAKMCFLFAKINKIEAPLTQTTAYNTISFVQHIITGTNNLSQFDDLNLTNLESTDLLSNFLYKTEVELGLTDFMNSDHLLLGIVFIPANYNVSSYSVLDPISLSNINVSYPLPEKTYKQLLLDRINKIDVWDEFKVFYKSQIIRHQNNLFIVHKTFGNGANDAISEFFVNDYLESSDQEITEGFISKINVDYTDPNLRPDGKIYWAKLLIDVKKPTNEDPYKYIVGTVPNLDPVAGTDISTIDLPEVTVNGVRFTVGYSNVTKDDAHVYFARVNQYSSFDEDNYTLEELDLLEFPNRNIKEGYYLVWNAGNTNYEFDNEKFDIVLHYKI